MKKITLFFALIGTFFVSKAQLGLDSIIVEKYYSTNSADSINASNNGSVTDLHAGSTTYRVFIDMAPGYKFIQMFGNTDNNTGVVHPWVIKTTTDFFNDINNGVPVGPQGTSVNNTKKNTTLIDSWLTVGGVCSGKMGVLKAEDTDGSIGNSNGVLTNNPGGAFGVAINSVVANAEDGLLPGSPLAPTSLGLGTQADIFDQTAGNTFSVTNGSVAGLGGVIGVTPSNRVLVGQFTTNGILSFSLNVQISNTVTNNPETYVPNNAQTGEFNFPKLAYTSATTNTVDTTGNGVGIKTVAAEAPAFSVYPNPSKGIFTISATHIKESSDNSYSIYDITGRLVLSRNLGKVSSKFSEVIDMSGFMPGLYFLNLSLDGKVSIRKLVKE